MKKAIASELFAKSTKVSCSGGSCTTLTLGPLRVGLSEARIKKGKEGNNKAKINGIALLLDQLLLFKQIKAVFVNGEDAVYMEYEDSVDGTVAALAEGNVIKWFGNIPTAPFIDIMPYILLSLSEAPETMEKINIGLQEFEKLGFLSIETLLSVSDAYYFEYAIEHTDEIEIIENAKGEEMIEQASRNAGLCQISYLPKELAKIKKYKMEGVVKTNTGGTGKDPYSVLENAKNGKYDLAFSWKTEQLSEIPSKSMLDAFIPSDVYVSLVNKLKLRLNKCIDRYNMGLEGSEAIGNDFVNVLLTGRPGTGKTTVANALGATMNMPVYVVNLSKNTEESVAEGSNKFVDGKLEYIESVILKAFTNGGIVVLEECNLADAAVVMGVLGQAVEKPFTIYRNGYEKIIRHPLCVFIATMNSGTFGSREISQAFSTRFKQTYTIDDPKEEDMLKVMMAYGNGSFKMSDCKKVYRMYKKILDYVSDEANDVDTSIALKISLRQCLGALENIEEGSDFKTAIRDTMIGKISESDPEAAKDVYDSLVAISK